MQLVLLPGLDGTGALFAPLIKELDNQIEVKVVTYPSDPSLGYTELVSLVEKTLPFKPTFILGESFSGPIAIEVAARNPALVVGLILSSTFLVSPWPRGLLRRLSKLNFRIVPPPLRSLALLGRSSDGAMSREVLTITGSLSHHVVRRRLSEISRIDVRPAIARTTCAILALHGSRDYLVPWSGVKQALAPLDRVVFKLLDGPHMLLQSNASDAAREIAQFLSSTDKSNR